METVLWVVIGLALLLLSIELALEYNAEARWALAPIRFGLVLIATFLGVYWSIRLTESEQMERDKKVLTLNVGHVIARTRFAFRNIDGQPERVAAGFERAYDSVQRLEASQEYRIAPPSLRSRVTDLAWMLSESSRGLGVEVEAREAEGHS
jgi:hypothetical protein